MPSSLSGPYAAGRPHRLATNTLAVCLVKKDGSVGCTGSLGFHDPHSNTKSSWVLAGVPPVVEVALGGTHGCVRSAKGEVWCWGTNHKGELGRGTATSSFESPAKVKGLSNVAQISSDAGQYTCARTGDGAVACWGNPHGEMETLDDSKSKPSVIAGVANAVDVTVSSADACATLASGRVVCWTSNDPTPRAHTFFHGGDSSSLSDVAEIAMGPDSACVRGKDGSVSTTPLRCDVSLGVRGGMPTIGKGDASWTAASGGKWAKVSGVTKTTSVAAGGTSGCALGSDGKVRCWGCISWAFAKRGAGPSTAVVVPNLTDADELVMGLVSACARKRDDTVVCWGTSMAVQSDTPTAITL